MAKGKSAPIKSLSRNGAIAVILIMLGVQLYTTCQKESPKTEKAPNPAEQSASPSTAQKTPEELHLEMGIPKGGDGEPSYLLKRKQYVLSYNGTKNVPNWVSYNLNAEHFGNAERKQGQFMPDPDLPPQFYKVRHQDYTGSGFDRGHLVRSEERTASREDNDATFYMTNILPQYHDLNAGPWLRLEEFCQYLAQRRKKELYIIAGGVYEKNYPTIGKFNNIAVPSHCFKIVVILDRGQGAADVNEKTTVIAALMPNIEGIKREQWRQYETSITEIERRTGYDFLTAIPPHIQKAIESKKTQTPEKEEKRPA